MVDDQALVQAIMLVPNAKRHQLSEVITAVASASATSLLRRDCTDSAWSAWLGGRFTKSVRVAKSHADFAAAVANCVYVEGAGPVQAAAFAPMAYRAMPRWMSKARVEGLVCTDDLPDSAHGADWAIGLAAPMTAGKAAAQVAHALCKITLELGSVPSFALYRAAGSAAEAAVEIIDAGLTEFGGVPTRTVVASPL
ncbi:hypothetical protein [Mycobacteroides abscessus]|uniref:hypothetical protein n=1 Tax=Mycobacteroides abscessus TaxID=36809 RepID=UPI000C257FA3|nr:hypothetical protein [Mycobacteroides abscessus]